MHGKKIKIVFFGTPEVAVYVLNEMEKAGMTPDLIITAPDKPKGRKLALTPPPAKIWADEHGIPVEQPIKISDITGKLKTGDYELFVVAAYGKIIPSEILNIPKHGTLNMHPSLLPRLRGASPVQSALLRENETGVTIMLLDAEMDHGPIVAQQKLGSVHHDSPQFGEAGGQPYHKALEKELAEMGGKLLTEIIPKWIAGKIEPQEQEHNKATYCEKITKQDGLITGKEPPEALIRKVHAFTPWPGVYFFANGKRIIITDAELLDGKLVIKSVKPEGKNEMPLENFLRGNPSAKKEIDELFE